jgi:hypothetical protein
MLKGSGGSDGGALATLWQSAFYEMWRRDVRPPSEFRKQKSPQPFPARASIRIAMMQLCG